MYLLVAVTLILMAGWLFGPRACYWVERNIRNELDGLTEEQLEKDKNFDFPVGFPADPGELGRRSIEGVDSDGDGVRDDLQRWIHSMHPNDTEKRLALRQEARFYQYFLQTGFEDEEVRREGVRLMRRTIDCERWNYKAKLDGYVERLYLKAKALNTYERTTRYLNNQGFFTRHDFPARVGVEASEQSCDRL